MRPCVDSPIGRRLREARERAGLSKSDLSDLAGRSNSVAGMIERGHIHEPSLGVLRDLAEVLALPVTWLTDGVGRLPSTRRMRAAIAAAEARRKARRTTVAA